MAHEKVTDFEKEFYPFPDKIVKKPELLKQSAGELKRILNKLLIIKDRAKLDAIVAGLKEIGLFKEKFYHHVSAIVKEVEANIYSLSAQKDRAERVKSSTSGGRVNKPSTVDRKFKEIHDYIKG